VLRLGLSVALSATALSAQQPQTPPPISIARPAPAEAQPQTQPPPPRFTTEANYVRLDVYPSKGGAPVLDLRVEDFDVLENGVRQKVQAFEHVVVSPAGPQSMRIEPNSVRAGEQIAANPRNRVFVVFLDVAHVAVEGSHAIKEPLIRLLDRVLGPDDLVAVMTPEMSAAQITFGRKTEVIADMLRDRWYWGGRHSILDLDEREREYETCFPLTVAEMGSGETKSALAKALTVRRRERIALDALRDLVTYLGTVREERKAILAVSSGWLLYRPDPSLTTLRVMSPSGRTEPVPGNEPIGVDPFGKLRVGGARDQDGNPVSQSVCDRERMYLASIDNEDYFRYVMDVANRNNASFYPIEPRGLAVFDSPLGPEAPPAMITDMNNLTRRIEVLRTLAENTDGLAVVNTNNLDDGLRRIADDLSSYYLLGYYSTNTKLDGEFRRITVRVNRPGVEVRARRGYRAPTAEEVSASRRAAAAPVPELQKTTTAALAKLARLEPEQRFRIHVSPARAGNSSVNALWVAGELHGPPAEFARGGTATIEIKGPVAATASAEIKPGDRAFLVRVPVQGTAAGAFDVRAQLQPAAGGAAISDAAKVALEPTALQPLLFKRGLSTGNRLQPAAGFEFSRTERLQLQLPLSATAKPGAARLLDRNAQPLQVPVQVSERQDADGQRWLVGDATLSALGAGDYVVEIAVSDGAEQRVLTAIRVTR
jgi:VWFA-related protein